MKQFLKDVAYSIKDFIFIDFKMFLTHILKTVFGIIRALLRLALVTILFVLKGLNDIIFSNREIVDFEFVYDYLAHDMDKLAYVDKLNSNVDDLGEEYYGDIIIVEDEEED